MKQLPSNWKKRLALLAMAATAATSLTGCWNDDDDLISDDTSGAGTSNTIPTSASASTADFIAFLNGLGTDNTAEPLDINAFTPPLDDAGEPSPVT